MCWAVRTSRVGRPGGRLPRGGSAWGLPARDREAATPETARRRRRAPPGRPCHQPRRRPAGDARGGLVPGPAGETLDVGDTGCPGSPGDGSGSAAEPPNRTRLRVPRRWSSAATAGWRPAVSVRRSGGLRRPARAARRGRLRGHRPGRGGRSVPWSTRRERPRWPWRSGRGGHAIGREGGGGCRGWGGREQGSDEGDGEDGTEVPHDPGTEGGGGGHDELRRWPHPWRTSLGECPCESLFGSPAVRSGCVALRPRLPAGLPVRRVVRVSWLRSGYRRREGGT